MPDSPTPTPESEIKKKRNRKKQERKFLISDADYLAYCRVRHKHFTEQLADFTALDPGLNIAFANTWFAKIEACEALPEDETTMHEMAGYREQLDKKITALIAKINIIEIFANIAFQAEPEVLYEFQFNRVNRPDQYNLNFIVNANVIKMLADVTYNAELTAAGMPPTAITDLENAVDEAASHEMYHEFFKRIRIQRTRIRIKEMNLLFDMTERVRKAALVIYADKPDDARLFQ